jgi:hypothetical protein
MPGSGFIEELRIRSLREKESASREGATEKPYRRRLPVLLQDNKTL